MGGRKAVVVVLDGVGIQTIERNIDNYHSVPKLDNLRIGSLLHSRFHTLYSPAEKHYAISQVSASANSMMGHREMMGVIDDREFSLFDKGFPKKYLEELSKRTGREYIFNRMAGGVDAIAFNYSEHEYTSKPIIYASKCDPVIQIAMSEDIIPVAEQHLIANIALQTAIDLDIPAIKAIARPYKFINGERTRTINRHDAVMPLSSPTLIDILEDVETIAVGKTADLVPSNYSTVIKLSKKEDLNHSLNFKFPSGKDTNPYNIQGIFNAINSSNDAFIFANLVDTDSLYGHTCDIEGWWKSIKEFDRILSRIVKSLDDEDLLIITADHGIVQRDNYGYHHKESVPLILPIARPQLKSLTTFATIGHLVAEFFGKGNEFIKECNLENHF